MTARSTVVHIVVLSLVLSAPCHALSGQVFFEEPISPIPAEHGQDVARAAIGERLFKDPRLSADNSISCATCHQLADGGDDGLERSFGVGGALGTVNSPTVFNAGFNLAQFWDGRAASLEEQIDGPLHASAEMASNWPDVVSKLAADPDYSKAFSQSYPGGITPESIRDAIATYERTLITTGSAFDRWIQGQDAMTDRAKEGYSLFKSYGCIACHQGANAGGNMYQMMGAFGDYFRDSGRAVMPADLGRFNITGDEQDRHFFKVPSLRLAVHTAPYFHDGSVLDLVEAIQIMGRYQLGRVIPDEHAAMIKTFIESLAGTHPELTP